MLPTLPTIGVDGLQVVTRAASLAALAPAFVPGREVFLRLLPAAAADQAASGDNAPAAGTDGEGREGAVLAGSEALDGCGIAGHYQSPWRRQDRIAGGQGVPAR